MSLKLSLETESEIAFFIDEYNAVPSHFLKSKICYLMWLPNWGEMFLRAIVTLYHAAPSNVALLYVKFLDLEKNIDGGNKVTELYLEKDFVWDCSYLILN